MSLSTRSASCLVLLSVWMTLVGPPGTSGQTRQSPAFIAPVDPHVAIASLLQSADPREQAWGAWYAGRDHLTQFTPLIQQIVARHASGHSINENAAVEVALDALIQMNKGLPSSVLASVSGRRPEQALILASFAARDDVDVDDFLFEVLRSNEYDRWFAAANLLLQRRTPGVAITIIRSLSISVQVFVTSGDGSSSRGFGSAGGMGVGCGAGGTAQGLPPWASYRLSTAVHPGFVVLSAGPTTVYYQRVLARPGSTPATSSVHRAGPTADDRLRYLGWLAGRTAEDLPVRGTEFREIRLDANASLERALESVRGEILSRWSVLAQALVGTAALTSESAAAELPALELVVHDSRQPADPPSKR